MTGQSLLDLMEDLNPELQLQSGEKDVNKALRLLNAAQDFFETMIAAHTDVLGGQVGTVTTTGSTESTAFPTGVLRVDRLQYIDPTTSRPAWDLKKYKRVGAHAYNQFWPWTIASTSTTGKPRAYWTNGRNIYWDPLPSGTHTVRWYGLQSAADITASGTFTYPDSCALPFSVLAVRLVKSGLEDPVEDVTKLATDILQPLVTALANFDRDGAVPVQLRYSHDT